MILVIDNYDSFTFNLVQYLGEMGKELRVFRNDAIRLSDVEAMEPEKIVISPGPGRPENSGIIIPLILEFAGRIPILGVCLGHQAIGAAFGGDVVAAPKIMHGKTSEIRHTGNVLFEGVPSPFTATRYHSLIIRRETCPPDLEIIAETDIGEIMAVAARKHRVWGVQFHPESILTQHGKAIIRNFLKAGAGK